MDEPAINAAVGRVWRETFPWELLSSLTEIDSRSAGTPGERRAATIMAEAFGTAGLTPTVEPFGMNCWYRGEAALTVRPTPAGAGGRESAISNERDDEGERAFETRALPYSPGGMVTGRLVDVDAGSPEIINGADLEGAIALTSTETPANERHVHRMETFGHAVEAGARAVVFANHIPGQLPPTGSLAFDRETAVPGVGVSAETGAWLREYAEDGSEATISVTAHTDPGTGHNVVGMLGPDTTEEIVVCGHYDAHDVAEGALDNGCGAVVLATTARLLGDQAFDLGCRVRFVATSGEELGLLGATALARSLDLDRVRAVVNIDGAGRSRDLQALTHGSDDLCALATRVVEAAGHPLSVGETPHPYSDHWPFLRAGVPALQFHSDDPEAGGPWERGWTHTRADTRDKVDRRDLREHGVLIALVLADLASASTSIARIKPPRTATRLRESGAEPGMRAAGIWPEDW
jgi:Zn-dependent M28 family amino/carboxypeptidase